MVTKQHGWKGPSFAEALLGRATRVLYSQTLRTLTKQIAWLCKSMGPLSQMLEAMGRRALVLKVLSKSIIFHVLQDKIPQLWQLKLGCVLLDINKEFIMAKFYSQEDYLKVLEGGPWMVMGNYLTITKWKPKFSPLENVIANTLVGEVPYPPFRDV